MDYKQIIILILSINFICTARNITLQTNENRNEINTRPIIGILSQEISYYLQQHYHDRFQSYIAASYVKFVEGAGARVIPIWIGKNKAYYEDVLSKINGVIFPGGNTYFNKTNGYATAGKHIYNIAKKMNENGDYFPILGICLGFELITYLEANETEHRTDCVSSKQTIPLEFVKGYRKSNLFRSAPSDIINILKREHVTVNFHKYCVTKQDLERANISHSFRVTSLNKDINGLEFISSFEHTEYPFYGLQFHPEKNIYEWVTNKNIPHSYNATKASQYFSDFFVNEARHNRHTFSDSHEEEISLIYNYPVYYTALNNSVFLQCYLFSAHK